MGFSMSKKTKSGVLYVLHGQSKDVETIIRTRSWMEDEVRRQRGEFSNTQLFTDYLPNSETFEFKIVFHK
jgi:exonuclease III